MKSTEVEFLEERIALLETWLDNAVDDDDDDNKELIEKREEYQGLTDEIILLQKKLRKTSKLISKEKDKKIIAKLQKKELQYSNEIEEIMNYAETDDLFEETAEIEPNELLGEPLETLMEQPGMEGSCASLNFSMSDFMPKQVVKKRNMSNNNHNNNSSSFSNDALLHPIAESPSHSESRTSTPNISSKNANNSSMSSLSAGIGLFTISTANSNTNNYDEMTLRKKLEKVNKVLTAHAVSNELIHQLSPVQVKKLMKKREQYTQALLQNKNTNNHNNSNGSLSNHSNSRESTAGPAEDLDNSFKSENSSASIFSISTGSSNANHYDESTLRKKLKKVNKMLTAHAVGNEAIYQLNPIEVKKLKKKHDQYTKALLNKSGNGMLVSPKPLLGNLNTEDEEESDHSIDFVEEEHEEKEGDVSKSNKNQQYIVPHDRKKLKKKLKKVKKLISTTDDPNELESLKQKKKEYKAMLDILKQQDEDEEENGNDNEASNGHNDEQDEEKEEEPEPEPLYNEENEERIAALKKKLRKSDKSIAKEDDPKKLKKMKKKRKEYQSELDVLLLIKKG